MSFAVSILSSGSSGNSLYVEGDKGKILIDAGLSGKKIEQLLSSVGRAASDLDAIFVTHEHSDHIKGVGVLSRRYHLPVYANAETWKGMEAKRIGSLDDGCMYVMEKDKVVTIGDLDIESFGVSHDARDAQFYQVHHHNKSFVDLTDTGYCSERLQDRLKNANMYLIESNHDVSMLRMGSYSWNLKQRILSDVGHLSNEDSAEVMKAMLGNRTKHIYLGHRSQENNLKPLAHQVMQQTLEEAGIGVGSDVMLHDTDEGEALPLTEVI